MDKFSLYDFLGLLLPGVIFMFFFNTIVILFGFDLVTIEILDRKIETGILFCFAVIIGAVLYTSNFYLVKFKLYNRLLGMYKHVANLYMEMGFLDNLMGKTLNKNAKEWYGKEIFQNKMEFDKQPEESKKDIMDLQDEYFDRMFYELEYHGKKEHPNVFHSFYFFFRQTALASLILLILIGVFAILQFIPCLHLNNPTACEILKLICLLILMLITSAWLAQWYRKRMVMKMYWTYYTHLEQTVKNQ